MSVCTATARAGCLVIAAFICVAVDAAAQQASQIQPARPITESAERISRELWPLDDRGPVDERGRPRFRARVTESQLAIPSPWRETGPMLGRIRPFGTLYHQEFLSVVTPEAFRGGTLYRGGIGMDPGTIVDGVKRAWRDWQLRRVRERIEKELAQLRARTKDSQ